MAASSSSFSPEMCPIPTSAPLVPFAVWVFENVESIYKKRTEEKKVRWSEIPGMKISERKRLEAENDILHRNKAPYYRRLYSCPTIGHMRRDAFCALCLCCCSNKTRPVQEYRAKMGLPLLPTTSSSKKKKNRENLVHASTMGQIGLSVLDPLHGSRGQSLPNKQTK